MGMCGDYVALQGVLVLLTLPVFFCLRVVISVDGAVGIDSAGGI